MTCLGKLSLSENLQDSTRYNIENSLNNTCNLSFSSAMNEFNKLFYNFKDDEKQYLLHDTNQSKVYSIKAKFDDGYVIGKIYKNKELTKIIREFVIIRTLKLMPYYDLYYDKQEKQIIIIMKLLQQNLTNYIKTHNINEYQCKLIIAAILNKLWKLHKIGYLHCDVKPSNIMKHEHEWFLIDFGYLHRENLKHTKEINTAYYGTIGWVGPEIKPFTDQYTKNIYSYSTDIWPIGILIIWLLFNGEQPYNLTDKENEKYSQYQQRLKYYYYTKLLRDGDETYGEKWLHQYLKSLYDKNKISSELFQLLKDDILVFDPNKRSNCSQIYKHQWFDQIKINNKEQSDESEEHINNNAINHHSINPIGDEVNASNWEWWNLFSNPFYIDSWRQYFEW